MNLKYSILVATILSIQSGLFAQDDLMNIISEEKPTIEYTDATFKTTLVVIGQSIENPPKGNLIFNVQHRFGTLNSGLYEFFGLDQANTRIGFQYGITDWLGVGIGRSSFQKTYDGWLKVKVLRQSSGLRKIPITIDYYGNIAISAQKWAEPNRNNYFSSRLTYANQLLIARKFSPGVSIQLMPTYIHYNLVDSAKYDNDVFSIGAGGRFKISKRVSINLEYYYVIGKIGPIDLSSQTRKLYDDAFSIGFDIETGGHVFQLYLSNSQGIIGEQFVGRTKGNWLNGDIHFGFNVSRAFTIKKPKEFRKD
jgi:opacity protein-like surface antigen